MVKADAFIFLGDLLLKTRLILSKSGNTSALHGQALESMIPNFAIGRTPVFLSRNLSAQSGAGWSYAARICYIDAAPGRLRRPEHRGFASAREVAITAFFFKRSYPRDGQPRASRDGQRRASMSFFRGPLSDRITHVSQAAPCSGGRRTRWWGD